MDFVHRTLAAIAVLLAAMICGCSSDTGTGESQDSDSATVSQGEHDQGGGELRHDGDEHGREGQSEHKTEEHQEGDAD